jgi:hypothetical protein
MAEKMREYTHMLEQAQGTIQSLRTPPPSPPPAENKSLFLDLSRRTSANSYLTEDEDTGISIRKETQHTQQPKVDKSSLYKHRIITSSKQNNNQHWLPQKGLRILLTDFNRF